MERQELRVGEREWRAFQEACRNVCQAIEQCQRAKDELMASVVPRDEYRLTALGDEYMRNGSPPVQIVRKARVGMDLHELEAVCGQRAFYEGFATCLEKKWVSFDGDAISGVVQGFVDDGFSSAVERALAGDAPMKHINELLDRGIIERK